MKSNLKETRIVKSLEELQKIECDPSLDVEQVNISPDSSFLIVDVKPKREVQTSRQSVLISAWTTALGRNRLTKLMLR